MGRIIEIVKSFLKNIGILCAFAIGVLIVIEVCIGIIIGIVALLTMVIGIPLFKGFVDIVLVIVSLLGLAGFLTWIEYH